MMDRRKSVNSSCETMCDTVQRLDKDINGNGQPGMKQTLQTIGQDLAAMRGAADERNKATERRHWWIMALLAALTIAVGIMAIPAVAHAFRVGDLRIPEIFQHNSTGEVHTASMEPSQEANRKRTTW